MALLLVLRLTCTGAFPFTPLHPLEGMTELHEPSPH